MHVRVRTTQNIYIDYPIASIGDRILAYFLDVLVLIFYIIVMIALLASIKIQITWIWILALGLPYLSYHLLFEIFMNGQTPGKYSMGIKVLKLDGTPATVGDYLMRWMFAIVDIHLFSGLIAILVIGIGGKGQRLGDLAAGTTVVKLSKLQQANAQEVFVPHISDYTPSFPQVVQLEEKDIELIQRALEVSRDDGNSVPVLAATEKIKTLLGIQTDLPPVKFLYTIIKDFQHLTAR